MIDIIAGTGLGTSNRLVFRDRVSVPVLPPIWKSRTHSGRKGPVAEALEGEIVNPELKIGNRRSQSNEKLSLSFVTKNGGL